jgi:hypothetical protein
MCMYLVNTFIYIYMYPNMPCKVINSKAYPSIWMKVFFAWSPPLSVSPSLRLMYHVYTFGALMSLLTSAIGQEEKKGRHRWRQWKGRVQRISKEKKKKNGPKSSAQKKTRDFFLLLRLGFFFYEWMKFALSLILSFFFVDKMHVCKFDHLFSVYDSLFFSCFLSLFYM